MSEHASQVVRDLATRLPVLQEEARKQFQATSQRRLAIELDTGELNKRLDSAQRLGQQAIVAVVLVGLLISSGVVVRVALGQNGHWDFLAGLAAATFVVSVVGAVVFVYSTLRSLARSRDL